RCSSSTRAAMPLSSRVSAIFRRCLRNRTKITVEPVRMKFLIFLCIFISSVSAQRVDRTIAVTIDDLPVVVTQSDDRKRLDITKRLLGHIKKAKVPAIGFVNENKIYTDGKRNEEQIGLLKMWLDAGL